MSCCESNFDVVISGGGLTGASLACALAQQGFKVAVVEVNDLDAPSSGFDSRMIALTRSSGSIFRNLGVWALLAADAVTEIRAIEVTEQRFRSQVNLHARDAGCDVLGWNVSARSLGKSIYAKLACAGDIAVFSPLRVSAVRTRECGVEVSVTAEDESFSQQLFAKVLVAADGGQGLGAQLGFRARRKEYSQRALVCTIESDQPHFNIAYEHFCDSGPLALLPVREREYSIVWTLECETLAQLLAVPDDKFLVCLKAAFGVRGGQFVRIVGQRTSYPLVFSKLRKFVKPGLAAVGNASHTVHPVAGQGFNLALRDVAAFTEVLAVHRYRGWDIGSYDVLTRYQQWRLRESESIGWFTDGLVRVFANRNPAVSLVRNLGLDAVQAAPAVKRQLLQRTMGLYGKQARLVANAADC